MRRSPQRMIFAMVLALWLGAASSAQAHQGGTAASSGGGSSGGSGEDAGSDFLFGDLGTAVGYAIHRSSFFELGYTGGFMPWITADGLGQPYLSGLVYDENKGPVINLLGMVLALMGVSDYRYVGSDSTFNYYIHDPASAARERAAISQTFSHLPLSMGVRGYSSALGSQADGLIVEASFRDPVGGDLPAVVWGIGLFAGYLRANQSWGGAYFESAWGGAQFDLRISLFEYMGIWLRVGAWIGGPSSAGVAVPIELGPEILLGNRFVLRGLFAADPVRSDAFLDPEGRGLGFRAELGVRL
jgi:hypothetical protein